MPLRGMKTGVVDRNLLIVPQVSDAAYAGTETWVVDRNLLIVPPVSQSLRERFDWGDSGTGTGTGSGTGIRNN